LKAFILASIEAFGLYDRSHTSVTRRVAVLNADLVFWPSVAFMIGCSLYFSPRIGSHQMAMQWGLDGRPTWHAPKIIGLWAMVGFALAVRSFIWIASTYIPEKVHGVEAGLLIASIVIAASHLFMLGKAAREH
jgi:apolipoprotein N-acyltransferase